MKMLHYVSLKLWSLIFFSVGYTVCYPLHSVMTLQHVLMVAAFILNTLCFVLAALYLYKLGRDIIGKGKYYILFYGED